MKKLRKLLTFVMISLILTLGIAQPCEVMASVRTLIYDNGDTYIGNVSDTGWNVGSEEGEATFYVKQGKGTYYSTNGAIITGYWKSNYLDGKATVRYANSEKFTGYFSKDKRNGSGTYWFKNGDKFTGKWKNDKMNGAGTYTWKSKNYVKGTWKNGKLHGKATLKIKSNVYSIQVSNGRLTKVYSRKKV